jgi:iron(III) transport system substrate-binding protein
MISARLLPVVLAAAAAGACARGPAAPAAELDIYAALDYVAAGAPLKMVVAEEGVIQQADGNGLIAGAPHPDPAADFLRWMSSREAHEVVRATLGRRSLRRDVAPSPGLMDLTGVKLIEADVDWITNHRDEILKQFEEARARASS